MREYKGSLGDKVTIDGDIICIKVSPFPRKDYALGDILFVQLKEPSALMAGKLTITTKQNTHQIVFSKENTEDFRELYAFLQQSATVSSVQPEPLSSTIGDGDIMSHASRSSRSRDKVKKSVPGTTMVIALLLSCCICGTIGQMFDNSEDTADNSPVVEEVKEVVEQTDETPVLDAVDEYLDLTGISRAGRNSAKQLFIYPESVSWPWLDYDIVEIGVNEYVEGGYLTYQNGYGNKVKSSYYMHLTTDADTVYLMGFTLDGVEIYK